MDAGVRVLNELIFEYQRSLEGIKHARLDWETGCVDERKSRRSGCFRRA